MKARIMRDRGFIGECADRGGPASVFQTITGHHRIPASRRRRQQAANRRLLSSRFACALRKSHLCLDPDPRRRVFSPFKSRRLKDKRNCQIIVSEFPSTPKDKRVKSVTES